MSLGLGRVRDNVGAGMAWQHGSMAGSIHCGRSLPPNASRAMSPQPRSAVQWDVPKDGSVFGGRRETAPRMGPAGSRMGDGRDVSGKRKREKKIHRPIG